MGCVDSLQEFAKVKCSPVFEQVETGKTNAVAGSNAWAGAEVWRKTTLWQDSPSQGLLPLSLRSKIIMYCKEVHGAKGGPIESVEQDSWRLAGPHVEKGKE